MQMFSTRVRRALLVARPRLRCGFAGVTTRRVGAIRPKALPEEGCLNICKGPFEALFKGEGGGLKMHFEPHLPETSCTVTMSWKANQEMENTAPTR